MATKKKTEPAPFVPAGVVRGIVEDALEASQLHLEATEDKIKRLKDELAKEEDRRATLQNDIESMGAYLLGGEQ